MPAPTSHYFVFHKSHIQKLWKPQSIVSFQRALALGLLFAVIGSVLISDSYAAGSKYYSIFGSQKPSNISANDAAAVELGMRFRSTADGKVKGIRFYKSVKNTGTHTGTLWSNDGKKIASVVFKNEKKSGWQSASFSAPVSIKANVTYVVSYHTNTGHYSYTDDFFAGKSYTTKQLTAPKSTASSPNGVFKYGSTGFPTGIYRDTNYWVDVTYAPDGVTPPTATTTVPTTTTQPATTTTKPVVTTTQPPITTTTTLPTTTTQPTTTTVPSSPGGLPTVATTGYQHTGVVLKACEQYVSNGDYVINGSAGTTVVDGCDFYGKQVRINGGGPVILKRSRVRSSSNCDAACAAVYIADGAGPVVIEDVEVTTTDLNTTNESARQDRTITVNKNNNQPVTIRRVHAHDTTRGVYITGQNNITFVDSYLAFNRNPPSSGDCGQERKHSSAIAAAGGVSNVLFKNTVLGVGECAFASGLGAFYPEHGANHDITFDGGLWIIKGNNDGAYGIAVGYTPSSEQQNYNFTVKNLQISTQYYASGCPTGCAGNWTQHVGSPIGPLGGTKVWQNVTKYNPGHPEHGEQILP